MVRRQPVGARREGAQAFPQLPAAVDAHDRGQPVGVVTTSDLNLQTKLAAVGLPHVEPPQPASG